MLITLLLLLFLLKHCIRNDWYFRWLSLLKKAENSAQEKATGTQFYLLICLYFQYELKSETFTY